MRRVAIILICVAVTVAGGAVFVASVEMPPPARNVEKVIPDDRLPR